jgi:hypothetical protein
MGVISNEKPKIANTKKTRVMTEKRRSKTAGVRKDPLDSGLEFETILVMIDSKMKEMFSVNSFRMLWKTKMNL